MSIHSSGNFPNSPFSTCYSQTNEQMHHYRQYNTDKQKYQCCNQIDVNPADLVTQKGCCYTLTTPIQYLDYVGTVSGCCYNQYYGGKTTPVEQQLYVQDNFDEIYKEAEVNLAIYNNFFCDQTTTTPYTIPTFTDTSVTCATGTPYMISYKNELDNSPFPSYVTVCSENTSFNQINTGNSALDYQVFRFLTNTGTPCTGSFCPLNYGVGNYNNLGNEGPLYQGKKPKNDSTFLGLGIALLVSVVIIYGVLGYYIFRPKEMKKG